MADDKYTSFGERFGFQPAFRCELQDSPEHLRNAIWNVVHAIVQGGPHVNRITPFLNHMAMDKHWVASEITRGYAHQQIARLQSFVLKTAKWHELYELIESMPRWSKSVNESEWIDVANELLDSVGSPWRMGANGKLSPIASEEELASLSKSTHLVGKYSLASEHMQSASTLFSKRPDPDYDNACKEAASAVESALLAALGVKKADFGQAIREFADKHNMHSALRESAGKLFGYANDREGVRHGAAGKGPPVDFDEAKLVLVSASAWVNYIAAKAP